MPTFITGLPAHVLVVHAVVVLVPLAVLGCATIALWPAARRRYGTLVLAVTGTATVFVPIAASTGDGLEHNLPRSPLIAAHAALGDTLLPLVGLLLVAVIALVAVDRIALRRRLGGGPGTTAAPKQWVQRVGLLLALTVLVMSAATAVQVVRIGDSGARAAWGTVQYTPQRGGPAAQL